MAQHKSGITVSEVETRTKNRIAQILALECPVELNRLKEHFATHGDETVESVRKALAAAAGDATKAAEKHDGNRPNGLGLPPAFSPASGLSDAARGRADALAASRLGFGEDPEIAKRNAERMKNIHNAGVTMVL